MGPLIARCSIHSHHIAWLRRFCCPIRLSFVAYKVSSKHRGSSQQKIDGIHRTLTREEHFTDDSVLLDTVRRFNGLERDVIFLWMDDCAVVDESLMYVGVSRAKTIIYIIGESHTLGSLQH